MAPHTTGEAIKGAIYTAALLEELGMEVSPKWDAPRTDLVQTVTFGKPARRYPQVGPSALPKPGA